MDKIINDSIETSIFSRVYPEVNKYVIENGDFLESRVGGTREIIDFSTKIKKPLFRCVGNNGRNVNIFFLMAEAIWIFSGKKDVNTLTNFNSKMKDFSDDGINFHAPYGFRLRHHGISSFENKLPYELTEENKHASQIDTQGLDQISYNLELLKNNPSTRRAVMQIWNSDLDLGSVSLDLPCNDLIFLKIRNGKLRTTISNRSNDLHWGLTTNIFQFSFMSEVMARILEIDLGTQTHNSQSLHIYKNNPIAFNMYDSYQITDRKFVDLYDVSHPSPLVFNFKSSEIQSRLNEIDYFFNRILNCCNNQFWLSEKEYEELKNFSPQMTLYYELLKLYIEYKYDTDKSDKAKIEALRKTAFLNHDFGNLDVICLAQNFFLTRLKDRTYFENTRIKVITEASL